VKRITSLLVGILFCQLVPAVELESSSFSVDSYRLYFSLDVYDLPQAEEGVTLNIYAASTCSILPVSYEKFRFVFNPDGGQIIENPVVTTTGSPPLDRWTDGPIDHLALTGVDFLAWNINGSIREGSQPYQPGDQLCMRIDVPGAGHTYSGLIIKAAPEGGVYLAKSSTTTLVTRVGQVVPYSYRIQNVGATFIHDVNLTDDNVDDPPLCAFSGDDMLAPEGQPGSSVFCIAEHTVSQEEIDMELGVVNMASVSGDEIEPVSASLVIPVALFASGFESPPNTFTILDEQDNSLGYPDIAIGTDGMPVITYSDQTANALNVAKCLNIVCTAARISVVDGGGNAVGSYPSIAIGNDLYPVISYLDSTIGALLVAKCNDESCSGGDETISEVDGGDVGWHSSITIGSDGLPIISYRDRKNGKLKVVHCNDAACSGEDETITTLNDAAASTGVNTSIAIGNDGYPAISYQDLTSPFEGRLKVAKCNDISCVGEDETITTLDTTGGPLFESTSLIIGVDGNPVVAYKDTLASAVIIMKCNDPACSGDDEDFTALDASTHTMKLSAILAPDGNPMISYLGSLKLAHCNDGACTGGDESIAIVDAEAKAVATSIAIGVDGLPIISYIDATTDALKVVHCGTLNCK